MHKIMVTGALGQIGTDLTAALRERYGAEQIVATDCQEAPPSVREAGPFEQVDVTEIAQIREVVERYSIDVVYHLAATLSAVGEQKP